MVQCVREFVFVFTGRGCFLTLEDAVYCECLLSLGETAEYDEWLNNMLENESPLSEIVLELSYCGSDYDKAISLLHNYSLEREFDNVATCDRLRIFYKDAYYSKGWSKERVLSAMRYTTHYLDDSVGTMYCLYDCYFWVCEGAIQEEVFDKAFFEYLENGTPIAWDDLWRKTIKHKPSFIERLVDKIGNIFKK